GNAGVNQEMNIQKSKTAGSVDKYNRWVNGDLEEEQVTRVQQVGRKTFYAKGSEWIDADATNAPARDITPVEIGSQDFFTLVDRLIALNQQGALALGPNTHLVVDGKLYQLR
ncbi:hypothetical protein N9A62_03785, partial [Akkermansiaceae bacterium]|nr:hypothetical protein [Akkermansiaceae bacterium]